ncbi:hypothetical protein FACS189475_01780 [Betaproteobacteria bacterium]|nr:hypothetical protein FACS189475_01780 [Betaproteobacteria bacterium]
MVTEQIGEGDSYAKFKRAVYILITDYELVDGNDRYHNRFTLNDPDTGATFTDLLEIDTLELPKPPSIEDSTPLWSWLKFLKATNEEELTMLSDKNPQIKKTVGKLMALSEDERARMLAESREKLRRDIDARVTAAEEKGRKEERLAMARKLLGRGCPIEEVMEDTGLSRKEIQSLLH